MTTKTNSPTREFYACHQSLYERGNDDQPVAEFRSSADLALIVSAVNSHAELVEALRDTHERLTRIAALADAGTNANRHACKALEALEVVLAKVGG